MDKCLWQKQELQLELMGEVMNTSPKHLQMYLQTGRSDVQGDLTQSLQPPAQFSPLLQCLHEDKAQWAKILKL